MVRRRPATVIGALCVSVALVGAPATPAQTPSAQTPSAQSPSAQSPSALTQAVDTGSRVVITDLPILSELPPLPAEGDAEQDEQIIQEPTFGMSAVQTAALALAVAALIAGAVGLTLVTRRSRSEPPGERRGGSGPAR